jgi:hypothetical protein
MKNESNTPEDYHQNGNTKPGNGMKSEALKEADCQRKNQRPREGKRKGTVIDLLLAFVIRAEKTD